MSSKPTPIGRVWQSAPDFEVPLAGALVPRWTQWIRTLDPERKELIMGPRQPEREAWQVVSMAHPDAHPVWQLVNALDGERSIDALDEARIMGRAELEAGLLSFYRSGMITLEGPEAIESAIYYQHAVQMGRLFLAEGGHSPIRHGLMEGTASERLAIAWFLDTYKFARAAASHIASAIVAAPSERLAVAFSEFLASEYWHFAWMKRGLVAAGLSEEEIEHAEPTPGMLSCINYLRWLATSDPLSYALCVSLGEGSREQLPRKQRFWELVARARVVPEEVFGPFRDHEILDNSEDHEDFGLEVFKEHRQLGPHERARVRKRVAYYARLWVIAQHLLVRIFGEEDGPVTFDPERPPHREL